MTPDETIYPEQEKTPYPVSETPKKISYTPKELAARLEANHLNQVAFMADTCLGKPLSINELNTLYYFNESLHMDADFIQFLFEYCCSRGKKNMRYIEKVAVSWYEDGLRDLNTAKSRLTPSVMDAPVVSAKAPAKNRFNDFEQRTYDFDDIERRLIAKVGTPGAR